MQYHRNAKTNINQRAIMQKSQESSRELAGKYEISHVTANKWKNSNHVEDANHTPQTIYYAVPKPFWEIVKQVREIGKFPLDDLLEGLQSYIPGLKRSNCYRILRFYKLNKLNEEEKREIRKFKKYPPGYLHIDCFYLPKINSQRYYVYLAIDRCTRMVFLRIYPKKDKYSAADFLVQALTFFPFRIHHILTDNGGEFTVKGNRCFYGRTAKSQTLFEVICELAGIEHRRTKAKHPWTNGMAERMVRTIKEHTIKIEKYNSPEEMIADVLHFQDVHNFRRKLKCLNMRTPYQITMDWFIKEPKLFIKHPNEVLTIR